jgi:phosphoenolpyruvate carboxykinase (GTP)
VSTPLERWVDESARLTKPSKIVWCDGSQAENDRLIDGMLRDGTYIELNQKTRPGCYLHRSNPNDVARTESITFICTRQKDDAGPTNNWMSPLEAKEKVRPLFDGAMKGRTMYVVPYILGPVNSPYSKVGVEITDSAYVVASMRIMSRMGQAALDRLGSSDDFVPGLHSLGDLNPDRRFVLHFPEEKLIWSVGSGYGGNALLGKKCFALRIASYMAREQGWMAEHMLLLGLEDPSGKVTYMAAAFPSACGKTNLAMMVSALEKQGYRVWTVGDDIAWMHIASDGSLRAINPEAGFFGVAPGTNAKTNPNVRTALQHDAIFTNVAMTATSREPWWEGINGVPQEELINWKGENWKPSMGPAAHPNSRYTVSAKQSPSISAHWEDPDGIPISAIIFGGRRAHVAPLVYQSRDWQHGVFVGATMASETTAASTGAVGVTRRDPMAMIPFCGYNMGDYFAHWLEIGGRADDASKLPQFFCVNWFRKDSEGRWLWPGYAENSRVLEWIFRRLEGTADTVYEPIGLVPPAAALNVRGLDLSPEAVAELLRVDTQTWGEELPLLREHLAKFGDRLPPALTKQLDALGRRLAAYQAP